MLLGSIRRVVLCVTAIAGVMVATAAGSWACASVAALDFDQSVVKPGQQVVARVTFVSKDKPVELRWDALNGPVLATIETTTFTEGLHGNWRYATGTITIPTNATAGNHLVIATQEFVRGTATWGMPARGLIQVSGAGTPLVGQQVGPPPAVRPDSLIAEKSVAGSAIVVAALGAAGFTMLIGGVGILLAAGRRKAPVPARVSTGTDR